ncbi:hypothetical protein EMIT0P44_140050 [Pseudomonas sp. IT-P44]|uniref:hypothetical protein n=1 Tax=Pseudomonas sp. IT-P44 TaxID=3026451 RepID=UPI0039E121F9
MSDYSELKKLLWSEVAAWSLNCESWQRNSEVLGEFLGKKTVEEVLLELITENEALRKAAKPIPADWALVPKEPTAEMVRFAEVCVPKIPSAQWRAMVCAAPEFAALSDEVGYDR